MRLLRYLQHLIAERLVHAGIGLVLGGAIGLGLIEWANSGPAVIVERLDEVDARVSPGDNTISFVFAVRRARACPVQVSRYLWRWVDYRGGRIREFRSIDSPTLSPDPQPGQSTYMMTFAVPPGLTPGQWFERTVTIEECPVLGRFFSEPPHISADHPITIAATP